MRVPLCFVSRPREARASHHIARDCRQLRQELEALFRETELPHEEFHELSLRLDRLLFQAERRMETSAP
jgi:ElaB/YqjD/DUF883 family membrane-anchored ribosome-binding protein